jgi:hypothetical protein
VRPGWRGQAIVAWAAAPAYVERIELEGRLAGDWVPAGGFTDGETEKLVNGLMPGQTYTFRLRAFAAGQYSAYTDPVDIVAPDGLTAVSLAAAPGSPVALGVPVVLTPTVAGGSDLLCAFYAKFPGATTYTALGSTSVEPLTWNPTTPGTYTLMVSAREARGTAIESRRLYIAVTPKLAKVALGAVPAAAGVLGRRVTLAASVTGGALVEFAFSVVGATGTVYERGFGSGRSTWWTPDAMGAYTLTVTARDLSDGTTQTATQPFTVKPPLSALGLASSLASPVATGTRVVLTAVATGGATPEYRFLYGYRPTAQTATSKIVWDKSMAFRTGEFTWWTPTIAGIYNIRAYAREKGTTSAYEVATSTAPAGDVVFEVRPALTDFTLTCAPGAGSTTNIRANPAGGVNLRWKFYARKKGTTTWALVHDYQSDPVAPWTPDAPGPWEVMVYTKEATSKLYYDLSRTVPYTVP